LVGANGEQVGIVPTPQAQSMAREAGLDLVEVAAQANPPVCKIMDHSKYKFEEAQRRKESRKKGKNVVVKEMKYRPKIGRGDFDTKTRKVFDFLSEGNKVKVTIMFRGREMQHPDLGRKILDQVADTVVDAGKVETYPRLDGRNMVMVLAPDKQAQALAAKRAEAAEAEEARAAELAEAGAAAAEAAEAKADATSADAETALAEAEPAEEAETDVVEATSVTDGSGEA